MPGDESFPLRLMESSHGTALFPCGGDTILAAVLWLITAGEIILRLLPDRYSRHTQGMEIVARVSCPSIPVDSGLTIC